MHRTIVATLLLSGLFVSGAEADGPPAFRAHVLNADAAYSACAVFDVDRDGKLDVYSGGYWYRAPEWTKHFVRDVEMIRGRYDGYSALPLDVNGDGWTDVVSANYRSQKIYWIENPGFASGGRQPPDARSEKPPEIDSNGANASTPSAGSRPVAWKVHVIAEPGPMETARLADVDGDGTLDVLPNGVRFAAWWELIHEPGRGDANDRWIRNELPREVAAHGVGFGDINGDGRGDVVCPTGWAEGPADPRTQRWRFHRELRMHRDAAIPILVADVDGDDDADFMYARGHHTGLYWIEQRSSADGGRLWTEHAIDTSWSQAHSLLLADLEGDGRDELIAGKRYMGHDGKDPGEYDPLVVCAYSFEAGHRTWNRTVLSSSWRIGFGLDPKAADLDGDGDLDLVCPGRSGLFWLENLMAGETERGGRNVFPERPAGRIARELPDTSFPFGPPLGPQPYEDHTRLLVYRDEAGRSQPVDSPSDWAARRAHILANLQEVLGPLPESSRRVPLDVRIEDEARTDDYVRRRLSYAVEPGDRASAWLLIPRGLDGAAPAMICLHQTTEHGKHEPAGLAGDAQLHYAHELARRGYVCLAPDHPGFGDDQDGLAVAERTGTSGMMKAVWNAIRAVDMLEGLPEVDRDRIGCIGHSLGGHTGLFAAAFDLRLNLVVTSCGFTGLAYDDLASWSGPRFMPRLGTVYGNDLSRVPFDFHEVLAAVAPRPVFVNAPEHDDDFAVAGVREVIERALPVFRLLGSPDALMLVTPATGHGFPDDVRAKAADWLDRQFKSQ